MLYDTTEINEVLNLINKDIFNLVRNHFYSLNNAYFASEENTPLINLFTSTFSIPDSLNINFGQEKKDIQ